MPELPEVHTIASDLNEIVGGLVIEEVAVTMPKIVAGNPGHFIGLLTGCRIAGVARFGKWIKFTLDSPNEPVTLLTHLKMTGQFHMGAWLNPDEWFRHHHVGFRLGGMPPENNALYYQDIRQFGRLRAFNPPELEEFVSALGLGPDPLEVSAEEFHKRLTRRKGRLKSVLLDQTTVAGLGNIYVDEGLFAAKLSPLCPASTLSRLETGLLHQELRRILTASIAVRGSTTSNYQGLKGGGNYQNSHQVYGRAGVPCPVCGGLIERSVVGGRSTHCCHHCQLESWSK